MKTTIIALSAAALIAAAPAVLAQGVPSKTPSLQHKVSKKNHSSVAVYAPLREMQTKGSKNVYPRAFGYAPWRGFRQRNRNVQTSWWWRRWRREWHVSLALLHDQAVSVMLSLAQPEG